MQLRYGLFIVIQRLQYVVQGITNTFNNSS